MTKFRKSPFARLLSFVLMISLLAASCTNNGTTLTQELPNTDPGDVPTSSYNTNGSALADFYCDLNLNEERPFEENYEILSQSVNNQYGAENPWSLDQSRTFKDQMYGYFIENNNNAFEGSEFVNVSDNFLNIVKEFEAQMTDLDNPTSIGAKAAQLNATIEGLNVSDVERDALFQMVDIYEDLGTCLFLKYPDDDARGPWIKCRWWQWACVAAFTAAAVALVAASGGALLPIIVAGGTMAMIAACCFCRCRCNFSHNC